MRVHSFFVAILSLFVITSACSDGLSPQVRG